MSTLPTSSYTTRTAAYVAEVMNISVLRIEPLQLRNPDITTETETEALMRLFE
jgi:hypothetical protein